MKFGHMQEIEKNKAKKKLNLPNSIIHFHAKIMSLRHRSPSLATAITLTKQGFTSQLVWESES